MKLGESVVKRSDADEVIRWLVRNMLCAGMDEARVEIHSLDDPPWSTERPEGWGVGCWCRFDGMYCLCVRSDVWGYTLQTPSGDFRYTPLFDITSFGPRVEVPR